MMSPLTLVLTIVSKVHQTDNKDGRNANSSLEMYYENKCIFLSVNNFENLKNGWKYYNVPNEIFKKLTKESCANANVRNLLKVYITRKGCHSS